MWYNIYREGNTPTPLRIKTLKEIKKMIMLLNSTTTYTVKFSSARHDLISLSDNLVEAVANYVELIQEAEYDKIMNYSIDIYNNETGEVLAYRHQTYENRIMNSTVYDTEEFLDALVESVKLK